MALLQRKPYHNGSRIKEIIKRLKKTYPKEKTALNYRTPVEILVATILSAQCTDERVNRVTETLFKKYHIPADYAKANLKTFEQEIRSTGFYHNKAKNIIGAANMIIENYGGKVPDTMEELLKLPGVARKTANIVLGNAYGKVEGIAVDTHVLRVSYRLGMTDSDKPEIIEQDLMKSVNRSGWFDISNMLIVHGRKICAAKKPLCGECMLNDLCPSSLLRKGK